MKDNSMKDNSLQIIDKIINNYIKSNGKHLLFKIAERGETFKIHSFEMKERINFETSLSGKEQKHSTETAMDSYEDYDYEITNDTLEKLKEDVYKIYQEETK